MVGSFVWYALAFVLALGVLVAFHEYGHFWTARRLGIKVLKFSVGFGKPLWQRTGADGTEYVLAAIPLGGYVKMLDEREGDVPSEEAHRAFNRQSVWTRIAVVAAGPIANFILAIAAYWLMFVIGISAMVPRIGVPDVGSLAALAGFEPGERIVQIGERQTESWESVRIALLDSVLNGDDTPVSVQVETPDGASVTRLLPIDGAAALAGGGDMVGESGLRLWRPSIPAVLDDVLADSAAEQAGLVSGDRIISSDDVAIADWQAWVLLVQASPGKTLSVEIERNGQLQTISLTPATMEQGERVFGRIGATAFIGDSIRAEADAMRTVVSFGPIESLWRGVLRTVDISVVSLQMIGKLVTGQASLENVSGPLTIAQFAGQSASVGFDHYLNFLALISVSLAVLNLLPVPILDGGHLVYYMIELVKGSPVSDRVQLWGQQLGLVLLAGLMALAFYNDILRLLG